MNQLVSKNLYKNTFIICITIACISSGCSGRDRSWQNQKDFVEKRTTLYNSYVVNGGFHKRDIDSMTPEEKKIYERAKYDILSNSNNEK